MLKVLLDTRPYGDGALSEGLGSFYAGMLARRPRVFLRAIAARPAKDRRALCEAAGLADGGGMSDEQLRAVRANLGGVARGRDARLAKVARDCSVAAGEANGRARGQRP